MAKNIRYDTLSDEARKRMEVPPARSVTVEGPWLQLTGHELMGLLRPLWEASIEGEPQSLALGANVFVLGRDRRRADTSWEAGNAALLSWWNWVGGTPGDACETHLIFLYAGGILKTETTDSCWMPSLTLQVWGQPPEGLLEGCVAALENLPSRR